MTGRLPSGVLPGSVGKAPRGRAIIRGQPALIRPSPANLPENDDPHRQRNGRKGGQAAIVVTLGREGAGDAARGQRGAMGHVGFDMFS